MQSHSPGTIYRIVSHDGWYGQQWFEELPIGTLMRFIQDEGTDGSAHEKPRGRFETLDKRKLHTGRDNVLITYESFERL
jgi:hypothetical protein